MRVTSKTLRMTLGSTLWIVLSLGCVSHRLGQPVQTVGNIYPPKVVAPHFGADTKPKEAHPVNEWHDNRELPFYAMAAVESGHNRLAVGDRGRAIGLYQIHREYWQDSGVPGKWEYCRDPGYSRRVILAYWGRYCPDALKRGDLEILCRVHNGGPQGHKKRNTVMYWEKIQSVFIATGGGAGTADI